MSNIFKHGQTCTEPATALDSDKAGSPWHPLISPSIPGPAAKLMTFFFSWPKIRFEYKLSNIYYHYISHKYHYISLHIITCPYISLFYLVLIDTLLFPAFLNIAVFNRHMIYNIWYNKDAHVITSYHSYHTCQGGSSPCERCTCEAGTISSHPQYLMTLYLYYSV